MVSNNQTVVQENSLQNLIQFLRHSQIICKASLKQISSILPKLPTKYLNSFLFWYHLSIALN